MSEKSKLYVFEKKEVALIFIFMLLIAVTSFMLGVKIGKSYSFQSSGLSEEDRQKVELMSAQEENVNRVIEDEKSQGGKNLEDQLREKMHQKLEKRVEEGLKEDDSQTKPGRLVPDQSSVQESSSQGHAESSSDLVEDYQNQGQAAPQKKKARKSATEAFKGKYTIQLGSYRSQKDAEEFARGFTIRGYNPIINQVEIPGRGTWYRVSLGVFNSSTKAKDYIKKEEELFQGQDYVIGRFD